MADNPFDQFDQPTQANPFDQFDGPTPRAPVPNAPPEAPGLLSILGGGVERGATSALASVLHTGSDLIDQTVQAPLRNTLGALGLPGMGDPLGAASVAATSLDVEREINADRATAAQAIGRPTLGDFGEAPLAAAGQYGRHIANIGAESLPIMAAAIATRSPELAASVLGSVTGAQEYTDLRGQGVDRGDAAQAAGLTGLIETAGEGFGLPLVMGKGRGLGGFARAALGEGVQEAPVQVGQQQVEDVALGRETPVAQQLGDALDAFIVGSGIGAGGHAVSVATDALARGPVPNAAPRPESAPTPAIAPDVLAAGNAALSPAAPLGVEPTDDIDALLAQNLPALGELAQSLPPEVIDQALGALDPDAAFRRPEPALPAAAVARPEETRAPAAQPSFAQEVAARMRVSAQEQAARATPTAPAVVPPAGRSAPAPAGGDLVEVEDNGAALPRVDIRYGKRRAPVSREEFAARGVEAAQGEAAAPLESVEESDPLPQAARKFFGTTNDPREAGYILPDGAMLDFTGRHYSSDHQSLRGQRNVDHRELTGENNNGDSLDDLFQTKSGSGSDFMQEFMGRTSAMRVDFRAGVASVMGQPTPEQIKALAQGLRGDYAALSVVDPESGRIVDETEIDDPTPMKVQRFFARTAGKRASPDAPLFSLEPDATESTELTPDALTDSERAAFDRARVDRKGLSARQSQERGEQDADAEGLRPAVTAAVGQANVPVRYLRGNGGLHGLVKDGYIAMLDAQAAKRGKAMKTAGLYVPAEWSADGKPFAALFTDVLRSPDAAAFTGAHEIAGHHGLRALLGDALDPALEIALQNPTVKAVADSMMRSRNLPEGKRMLAAEEALADLAGAQRTGNWQKIKDKHGVDVPAGIRSRVAAAVANFVRRLKALFGRQGAGFSDAQVRELLEGAWQAARGEEASTAENDTPLESVESAESDAEARRNAAAGSLPVARGAAGWDYSTDRWEGRAGHLNTTRAHLQDKMLAWRDVQGQIESQLDQAIPDAQNVYRLENLMHGRVSEGIDRFERNQVKPLMEAMRAAKVEPATLEEYLYARHAAERNAQIASINPAMPDGGSGMTNDEAAAILQAADKATLDPLARKVDAIATATRRRLLDHGLITQEAFDAMDAQYQHYVPLRGKATKETEFDGGTGMAGRGLDSRGKPVRQALGRGAGNRAQHILGEVIGDAERSVILAEKARVGRAVMRLVLANPNPSLWQVEPVQTERALDANGEVYEKVVNDWSDPSVVAVRHKGQLYKVQVNSQPLAQALNNIGIDQIGGLTRVAGAVNRYFSAILTKYNPAFTPVNATRDALFGLTGLAAEHGELAALDAALHYPLAARAAFRQATGKTGSGEWGTYAAEFAEAGGKTGYVNLPSAEEIARKIGSGKLTGYSPDGLRKAVRGIADAVGAVNDAVENALRLSAYVTLRKRGKSAEQAAAYAKDLTVNFNRKGFDGSKWNAWFLFYNASIQGAHRTSKLLRKPKTYAYLGMLAGAQVLATLAAMGMEDDDGEPLWNKVPDYVKRRNIVIVTRDGGLVTIPMPYGFNLFPYMAGRITEMVANGQRGDDRPSDSAAQLTADLLSTATQSFSPVPLDTGVAGLVPNLLRIPLNVWANRNDFGNPIRDEQPYAKSDVPRASMGKPDTLEVFKLASTGLNRIGGGDDLTPPPLSAFDVAPEDLEYLLKELTGGPGKLVTDIATVGQKITGGDYAQEAEPRDIPILNRFLSNIDEQAAQQAMFYDRREVIDRSLKRVRRAYKTDGAAAAEALLKATPELKGAAFKRRKRASENGPVGSIILTDGNPQIVAVEGDSRMPAPSVYAAYKRAEEAIGNRNEAVDIAYTSAPATILPSANTRARDAALRTENRIRQAAQAEFNAAWVRDVVGAAE